MFGTPQPELKVPRSLLPAWWGVILAGLLSVCCGHAAKSKVQPEALNLVWPEPPETARIAFIQLVERPSDLGIKRSAFGRVVNWITGAEKGNEPLVKPFGLGLDEKENLCLTDTGSRTVSFYDREARKWHTWSKAGKLSFVSPVAVAKAGNTIFVADSGRGAVMAFDLKGKLLFSATNHLGRPSGLVLRNKTLMVADSQRHAIVTFDLQGKFLSEFGRRGTALGEFNYPTHLAVDSQQNVWVTDSMNSRVQMFDSQGQFKKEIGTVGNGFGQFSRPKGIAVDRVGRLYAVDGMFDNIQIFNESGQLLLPVGSGGTEPGRFWLPNGIAINSRNEIFVADSYNRRLQILKYVGPP